MTDTQNRLHSQEVIKEKVPNLQSGNGTQK